jgi:cytosine/adenosine deaminase-related metal-dependent hydrolase
LTLKHRLAGAFLLASSLLATPALADGLYDNVNGMTLDEDGKLIRFTGILIDRDGKVSKLLDRKDKRPRELDWREDGDGRTLMPGFIDAHGHVMGLGFQQLTLDRNRRLCAEISGSPMDHRPRLEPGKLGPRAFPDGR